MSKSGVGSRWSLVAALVLPTMPPSAAAAQVIVSVDWLRDRLNEPSLVVVHTGMDRADYDRGHLPGARFAPLMDFHAHGAGLPPVPQLVAGVEALGIGNDSRVVITGDPMSAAILYVALDYLGHGARTSVLDGGLDAWRAAGGTLSTELVRSPRARFSPSPRTDLVVSAEWIQQRLRVPGIALLDARSPAEFAGATDREQLPRFGHIPGAGHLDWIETFVAWTPRRGADRDLDSSPQDPRLKPADLLRERFAAAGAAPGDTVVAYCTVGMRASHLYLVARHLGFPARLYVGSMTDWTTRAERPVARP